jgi:hypothetical protein
MCHDICSVLDRPDQDQPSAGAIVVGLAVRRCRGLAPAGGRAKWRVVCVQGQSPWQILWYFTGALLDGAVGGVLSSVANVGGELLRFTFSKSP